MSVFVSVPVSGEVRMSVVTQRPEETIGSLRTGIPGACKPFDMGVRNQILEPVSHLSSPKKAPERLLETLTVL